jgi:hypothetical protein
MELAGMIASAQNMVQNRRQDLFAELPFELGHKLGKSGVLLPESLYPGIVRRHDRRILGFDLPPDIQIRER